MNKTRQSVIFKIGFVPGVALSGFKTYGQPSIWAEVSVGLPSVEIHPHD